MFKSRLRAILSVFCLLVVGFGLFVFLAYIYGVPNSKISILMFKIGYSLTLNKKTFLEAYSPKLRDVGAGYVPEEVDEFLCQEIEESDNSDEIAAIVNFYIVQAGGREGNCIFKTFYQTREKIAKQVIAEMENEPNFYGKMVLLEQVRLGKSLGKGRITAKSEPKTESLEEWHNWFNKEIVPKAKTNYQNWWNSNLDWEQKKNLNPLGDTEIKIVECCG